MQDEKFKKEIDQKGSIVKSENQDADNASKDKDSKLTRNYRKIVGRVVAALILLAILVSGVASYYMFNLGINSKFDKSIVFENNDTYSDNDDSTKRTSDFFKTQKYKDRFIKNDGLRLHAYDFNQGSDVYVINVHGYTSQGSNTGTSSKWFYDQGYNVLAVDCRGHGKSEGDYIGMGWLDRMDVIAWINELVKQNPKVKIMLFGVSMGGATVMNTTGEKLPPNVKLAIEDCGFTSPWNIFSVQMKAVFGLPSFPILNYANLLAELKAGYNLQDGSINQVKKAKVPTLYAHGSADKFVPFSMLDEVFTASHAPDKEKLVIDGAGHSEGMFKQPKLYWNTVKQFIHKHL